MDSTVFCFELEPRCSCAELILRATFGFGLGAVVFVEFEALGACLVPRGRLAAGVLDLTFLLMAIRPSLSQRQHHVLPLQQAPRIGQGKGRRSLPETAPEATTHAPSGIEVERNVEQSYGFFRPVNARSSP
jgi:hypothetical protein